MKNCDNCKHSNLKANEYPCIECAIGDIDNYWKPIKLDCNACILSSVAGEDLICKDCSEVIA